MATLEHAAPGFFSLDDRDYMAIALDLAERGRGVTHPNPLVGALVVADGEIVGRGHHRGPGSAHAEAEALACAGRAARGATLYSTLEPCCTHGRTPPCTEAIVAAGVARVAAALKDPNPAVSGGGFAALREAGVEITLLGGAVAQRASRQNEPFAAFMRHGLPLVTYKAAVSLDGKVAAAGGDARWISSPESRRAVHALRAVADAVVVGAGTVRRDDPLLTVRDAPGRDPVRVVFSRGGRLPPDAQLLRTAPDVPTLVVVENPDDDAVGALRECGAEVVPAPGGLRAGLAALAQRGLLDLLCEGGPTLAGAMLAEGLIGRMALFIAPCIIGRGAPDLVATAAVAAVESAWSLDDVSWRTVGSDLLLEARVVGGPADPTRGRGATAPAAAAASPATTAAVARSGSD